MLFSKSGGAIIPDPGEKFLGSHPPNAARIAIVRRTAAAYATN